MEFHISRAIREAANVDDLLFGYSGNVVFANPKDTELKNGTMVKATLPLQAADLLAHKAFRIYQSETSGKEIERGTPEWELKAKGNLLVSHITEQDSLDFMARIEKKHRKGNCAN